MLPSRSTAASGSRSARSARSIPMDVASRIVGDPITVSGSRPALPRAFKGRCPATTGTTTACTHTSCQSRPPEQRRIFIAGNNVSTTPAWAKGAVQTSLDTVWGIMHRLGGHTHPRNPGPGDVSPISARSSSRLSRSERTPAGRAGVALPGSAIVTLALPTMGARHHGGGTQPSAGRGSRGQMQATLRGSRPAQVERYVHLFEPDTYIGSLAAWRRSGRAVTARAGRPDTARHGRTGRWRCR